MCSRLCFLLIEQHILSSVNEYANINPQVPIGNNINQSKMYEIQDDHSPDSAVNLNEVLLCLHGFTHSLITLSYLIITDHA